jgi:hypothetical protein
MTKTWWEAPMEGLSQMTKTWWEAPMEGSVLSFFKAESKVSDAGSAHWS